MILAAILALSADALIGALAALVRMHISSVYGEDQLTG